MKALKYALLYLFNWLVYFLVYWLDLGDVVEFAHSTTMTLVFVLTVVVLIAVMISRWLKISWQAFVLVEVVFVLSFLGWFQFALMNMSWM